MRTFITAMLAVASVAFPGPAQAQTLTTEFDLTGGYSSEDRVKAAAAQLRLFGEAGAGIRFNVETIWAGRSNDATDAFGAAYPYGGRVQVSEAFAERTFQSGSGLVGVRVGQYRTPFGIYNRSDYAYSGYLRAPLIRYEGYWALTNNFLERGVDVVLGTSRLSVEVSLAAPGDLGNFQRRSGLDRVVRAQGYYKALIVGASHIDSVPYGDARYATGRMNFNGVDGRFTLNGVQVSGEFLHGQPWDGPTTTGWYVDATFHRPFMGPLTAVFRTEQLDYRAPKPFAYHDESGFSEWRGRRQTAGGRVRLPGGFTAQAGIIRPSSELGEYRRAALDVALTYSVRR
jgi:hypothetical protein